MSKPNPLNENLDPRARELQGEDESAEPNARKRAGADQSGKAPPFASPGGKPITPSSDSNRTRQRPPPQPNLADSPLIDRQTQPRPVPAPTQPRKPWKGLK